VDDVRKDPRYVEFPNSDFGAEHERMLGILGSYIAIALENSRLYAASRENELRLLSDLETARDIQRQLLPQNPRKISGLDWAALYHPARELAGDFYDFLPSGEERLNIGVGDVSGKGTAAALYASMAIGILGEQTAERTPPPAELMATLNGRLCASRISPGIRGAALRALRPGEASTSHSKRRDTVADSRAGRAGTGTEN
jgi:phosphoserine phosphatase RsbU/P